LIVFYRSGLKGVKRFRNDCSQWIERLTTTKSTTDMKRDKYRRPIRDQRE
jgi:hypothetical protein